MLTLQDAPHVFAPLAAARGLVLAVSGGPDSVALMLLAAHWPGRPPMTVATVDHGLRTKSAAEAETMGRWAAALGLPHQILVWHGEKPESRIQERAREARYALLLACAVATGADAIVTAHHADDQAETILFRLLRGSGPAGLAGMRAAQPRGGVTQWRPLLDYPKADLVALCARAGHPWFDDPSNRNENFARPRQRRLGPLLAAQGVDRTAILRLGHRAARAEAALDDMAQRLAPDWPIQRSAGQSVAPAAALVQMPAEIAQRLLAREILHISGARAPLRLERLERASASLSAAVAAQTAFAASLGGVVVRLDRAGVLRLCPESPRRRGRNPAPDPD